MLACEMATVAWAREREQARVELEPDQEHVEDDADLRDDAEIRPDFARQHEVHRRGRNPPQERRPEHDAGDDLADHPRLAEVDEQLSRASGPAAESPPAPRARAAGCRAWRRPPAASADRLVAATGVKLLAIVADDQKQADGDDQHQRVADRQPPGRWRVGVGRKGGSVGTHKEISGRKRLKLSRSSRKESGFGVGIQGDRKAKCRTNSQLQTPRRRQSSS